MAPIDISDSPYYGADRRIPRRWAQGPELTLEGLVIVRENGLLGGSRCHANTARTPTSCPIARMLRQPILIYVRSHDRYVGAVVPTAYFAG